MYVVLWSTNPLLWKSYPLATMTFISNIGDIVLNIGNMTETCDVNVEQWSVRL